MEEVLDVKGLTRRDDFLAKRLEVQGLDAKQ